jgi:hypothetical protein
MLHEEYKLKALPPNLLLEEEKEAKQVLNMNKNPQDNVF